MKRKAKTAFTSVLSLLLAVVMVVGAAPLSGFVGLELPGWMTAEAATSGIYTYEIADGEATITDCDTSASGAITIPSTLGGYPVTSIGGYAFHNCDSLTSVTIPNSVTSISLFAFCGCSNLISVTIGNGVTSIASYAFYSCENLTNITVDISNQYYSSVDGVLFNKDKTILIQYPIGNTRTSYTIPDSVTSIGDYAFEVCRSLTSVTIPDSVTSIGAHAFYSCDSLTSVTIGNSVTNIDSYAFYSCDSLTSVTIPDSVTSIGFSAFARCDSLTSVTIPDSVESIGEDAFYICHSLENVIIGNSVTSIGSNAFCSCDSLTSVTIGNGVTSIGGYAFAYCDSLTDVYYNGTADEWEAITIGSDNDPLLSATIHYNSVSSNIFSYTITNGEVIITDCDESVSGAVTIPSTIEGYPVTSIGNSAFSNCYSLTNVTIPDSVTSIGDGAFFGCTSLTSVTIPNSVTSIGNGAFWACYNLTNITVDISNQYYSGADGVLFNKDKTVLIQYPIGNKRTSYIIPNSVTSIGDGAFDNCDSLTSVTIPDSVTSIGYCAFNGCQRLISVTIPDSVTSIGDSAFELCSSLTSVTIPDSVTSIGDWAFGNCDSLTNIAVDNSNKYYSSADGVLFNKYKTVLIQYPVGNKRASYTIPDSVTSIGGGAFWNCCNLTSVTIPNSVTSIGDLAFYDCTGLSDVYYNGTADEWEAITIGSDNDPLLNATIHYNQNITDNIYNLGEETYSFENFSDSDSEGGHCFGMAVTSSGYYIGSLNKSIIGSNDNSALYSFGDSSTVRKPICHYQKIQGPGAEQKSIVAGGSKDLYGKENIESDWNACVNYVKNHEYDNKGSLNIGMWFADGGGHAVNFLYYKEVNGQQRIYAYDNNFPETETYYYMGSDGYVHQAPKQTTSRGIVGIDLMDAEKYFTLAEEFDFKRYIYANKNEITVEGATMYYMKCSPELGSYVMYEIPAGVDEVTVVPLVDNAEFEYFGEEYAFGEINDKTSGILKLATDDKESASQEPSLTILNAPDEEPSIFAKIFETIGKILLAPVNLIVSLFKAIIGLFK